MQGGVHALLLGEGDGVGFQGRENGGGIARVGAHVAAQRRAIGGDLVELGRRQRDQQAFVAAFECPEEFLVAGEALDPVLLDDPGPVAEPAGVVKLVQRGEQHGGRQQAEPGDQEKPARVERDAQGPRGGRGAVGIGRRVGVGGAHG